MFNFGDYINKLPISEQKKWYATKRKQLKVYISKAFYRNKPFIEDDEDILSLTLEEMIEGRLQEYKFDPKVDHSDSNLRDHYELYFRRCVKLTIKYLIRKNRTQQRSPGRPDQIQELSDQVVDSRDPSLYSDGEVLNLDPGRTTERKSSLLNMKAYMQKAGAGDKLREYVDRLEFAALCGSTTAEIATQLDTSPGNVRVLRSRLRDQLVVGGIIKQVNDL